jgi:hypothetical protein
MSHVDKPGQILLMRRSSRDRLLVNLLGLCTVVVGCSRLTAVDWGLIPLASGDSAGTTANGGAAAGDETGGAPDVTPSAGASGEASGGDGGAGGQGGESSDVIGGTVGVSGGGHGGNAGTTSGGTAGTGAGNGGSSGGGTAGTAGGMSDDPTPCTGTTGPLTSAMVLFKGPAKPTAARGGRAGLDADCEAERVKLGLAQTKTHAFISVDDTDYLANWGTPQWFQDLPQAQRIVGPTGMLIATSWNDLLLGKPIEQSLICAAVLPADAYWWLSGNTYAGKSSPPGSPDLFGQFAGAPGSCNGWTLGVSDINVIARPGAAEFNGPRMLAAATPNTDKSVWIPCGDTAAAPILCLAYTP